MTPLALPRRNTTGSTGEGRVAPLRVHGRARRRVGLADDGPADDAARQTHIRTCRRAQPFRRSHPRHVPWTAPNPGWPRTERRAGTPDSERTPPGDRGS